jgi:hypothetical protein
MTSPSVFDLLTLHDFGAGLPAGWPHRLYGCPADAVGSR